jgi:hypothetical protein
MLTDSIDEVAVLRAAAASLSYRTWAPSTVGSWPRSDTWCNVRHLDAISPALLAPLRAAGAGPHDLAAPLTIDLHSTTLAVHEQGRQGAAFGYTEAPPATTRTRQPSRIPSRC